MSVTTGTVLGGRYRVTSHVAVGGMGEVWAATDEILGRTVAVKVLHGHADESFLARFRDEARHTASLSHPHIATVFDYGESSDGGRTTAYLVMELIDGEPLSALIARGPVPPERARQILGQCASALVAAHAAGVVHRDIKPANILLDASGQVKLTDFGIARVTDAVGHTRTGDVMGTPQYISPEQALGQQATTSSDLYSLGVVAHEMLTAARPFDAPTPVATALMHVNDEPEPLPAAVPTDLAAVVSRLLAKDPAARPASATDLLTELGMPSPSTPQTGAAGGPLGPAVAAGAGDQISDGQTAILAAATQPVPSLEQTCDQGSGQDDRPGGAESRFAWWWVALPLLLIVGGLLAARLLGGSASPDSGTAVGPVAGTPTSTSTAPTSTTPATATATSTGPTPVMISPTAYIGFPLPKVTAELTAMGLIVQKTPVPSDATEETVLGVTPTGTLMPGATVTVTFSMGPQQTAAPVVDGQNNNANQPGKAKGKGKKQ